MGDNGWIKVHDDPNFVCPSCMKAHARGFAAGATEMRERAAKQFDGWLCLDHGGEEQDVIQARILALPVTAGGERKP